MKKLLSIVLALAMLLTLTTVAASAETADEGTWKVAILTGTTSQGEEEFRAAERARVAGLAAALREKCGLIQQHAVHAALADAPFYGCLKFTQVRILIK